MVAVPAGEFTMGSDDIYTAEPPHQVMLDGYWIDRNLVTVAQYKRFCEDTGRKMPDPPKWGWKDDHPIVNVTWGDAKAYADWAGASLPTEAQWEKAARGTDGRIFPWGNDWDSSKLWCSVSEERHATAPAGSFLEGASPYGALDMAGNVMQWCADYYGEDYYMSSPAKNPTGPEQSKTRVLRGGSWFAYSEEYFRCDNRNFSAPDFGIYDNGFRCVVRASG
jgi:formylglycine-generating enzyme required for sulfatase activity